MEKAYTEKDIKALSDREHVRLRTAVYLGSTEPTDYLVPRFTNEGFKTERVRFIPAVYKAIGEIIDNSIDEFAQTINPIKRLEIFANPQNGFYMISDTGRGVPIGKHETGVPTPEIVFGHLRSGRNFSNDREAGVIGMNGVGAACTNFCSLEFKVDIKRDGQQYHQVFSNGGESVSKPVTKSNPDNSTGTKVEFVLDPTVFKDITLPESMLDARAKEIAFNNPTVTVCYNAGQEYRFRRGFDDIISSLDLGNYYKFETKGIEWYVVPVAHESLDERVFTWVNSSYLFDGGICNTQFVNAFCDKALTAIQPQAKKLGCEVNKNDIRKGLLVFGILKISNPQYDSQAKTRLTGPTLRKDFDEMIDTKWKDFAKKFKPWIDAVIQEAAVRHHTNKNSEAINKHKKQMRKKAIGLLDAVGRGIPRSQCRLFVTEGLSASSSLVEVRNPNTDASFPLGGKINNVYGSTVAQVLKMGKLTDLLASIGLTPGQPAIREQLRFGKVIIATDADYDGADIFTTLVCLFYCFWPELFDPKKPAFVHRLLAPNVVASKNKQRIHFASRTKYEQQKEKYKNWSIEYLKGLGSMQRVDWEIILNDQNSDTLISILDDSKIEGVLELLFGPSADARKLWLMENNQ